MPIQPYPASWPEGSRPPVREYPIKSGQTYVAGDILKLTSGECEIVGADPAAVLGIAAHDAADTLVTGKQLVYIADANVEWNIEFTGTLTAADVGVAYGVTVTSGAVAIDEAETVATVFRVTRLDPNDSSRVYAKFGGAVTFQG